jgi:hypothetical protein
LAASKLSQQTQPANSAAKLSCQTVMKMFAIFWLSTLTGARGNGAFNLTNNQAASWLHYLNHACPSWVHWTRSQEAQDGREGLIEKEAG